VSDLLPRLAPKTIGLIGHVIANYPQPDTCRQMIATMQAAGAALVEVQIPFSEPIADGPLFLAANHQALKQGVRPEHALALVAETKAPPLVLMTYANILFRHGYESFVNKAAEVGCRGFIVPDLAPDSAPEFYALCRQKGLCNIAVVPPNVEGARLAYLCEQASGFIYLMARAGVTGKKTALQENTLQRIAAIRKLSSLPVAVGFGISTPADIAFLRGHADYAIVGSQSLRTFQESGVSGLQGLWESFSL